MKKTLATLLSILMLGGMLMTSCGSAESNVSEEKSNSVTSSEEKCEEVSANTSEEKSEEASESREHDLAYGCPYYYDCGLKITGDKYIDLLTNGKEDEFVTLTTSLDSGNGYSFSATDWNGNSRTVDVDNSTAAISVDLGFISAVTGFSLTLDEFSGEKCEVYYSTDGYNYSFYAGEYSDYDGKHLAGELAVNAKSLMFVLPITPETELKISSINVFGSRENSRVLLSGGASYIWEGTDKKGFEDDGKKLTDGKTARDMGEDAVAGRLGHYEKDEITGKSGQVITIDLGSVKNVSELDFRLYMPKGFNPNFPERITVRISSDNNQWSDFGQSYLRTAANERQGSSRLYLVTRNHTVKARYIKIYTYLSAVILTDEIYVYGSETEVAEPDYDFIQRKNQLSNSNVAAFVKTSLNGNEVTTLTDNTYSTGEKSNAGENTVKLILNKSYENVCGAAITFLGKDISDISIQCGRNDVQNPVIYYEKICNSAKVNQTVYVYFDSTAATSVTVTFNSEKSVTVKDIAVYSGQPQLPLVRGGFFQMPTSGGGGGGSDNSEYSWYLQLKGMKDLGMEYVVVQYATHYTAKSTLINGTRITAAGYQYNQTYGCTDVCGAILNAADKLGMQVYIGTIHDSDFNSPYSNIKQYEAIVADSEYIIKDIYELYGGHQSFAGYYLSDEECDQWLNMNGGVEAGRIVYKGQSDIIRAVAPDAKIMIAPAIWRSGNAVTGADNLYRLIAPENEGEKPVVDIVAAQDCLGRTSELYVTAETYAAFEAYCEEWAKAVRRAGAEFWHDAEVFEIIYTSKRYDEIVNSLNMEAKLSGTVIVFDIPHFFTTFPSAKFDDVHDYYKRLIMRKYVKYYSDFASLDRIGADENAPYVNTDDGREVIDKNSGSADPKKQSSTYNEGVINWESLTPSYSKFKLGNGKATPEFAFCADKEAFYVYVKTNDTSEDYQNGVWWTGEDDLLQIWMTSSGETVNVATNSEFGVRYYIHRTKNGWETGGETGGSVSTAKFEYTFNDGEFTIKMPWSALGIKPQTAGNGNAIGIVIQYIDGSDKTWAASEGTKGQNIGTSALYSY